VAVDETRVLLRLLQVSDSGFPTGAFAFSHGLEGLAAAGLVSSEAQVAEVMAAHLREGFAGIECPATARAWRAAREGDLEAIGALDRLLDALKPVPVFRKGSLRTGRRLLESSRGVIAGPIFSQVCEQVRAGALGGHHAVAFGVVMESAGVDEEMACLALGAGFVNNLAAAAVRLGIIGAGAGQRLVAALHEEIAGAVKRGRQTEIEEMGAYLPMIDIAGLRQPSLPGRVFAS
jgi:urease accessory protein